MAKAKVGAAGIEYIQGALKRPKKQNGHNHGNYLVMTHRSAETTNPNCQRIYSFDGDRYDRKTPLSENEMVAHTLFRQRAAWVKQRSKSLQHLASDQQAYLAQRDLPNGLKSLKAYYWSLAKAEITAESIGG